MPIHSDSCLVERVHWRSWCRHKTCTVLLADRLWFSLLEGQRGFRTLHRDVPRKQLHKERFPGSNLVERTEVEAAMQPEQMFDWICYGFSPRTVPAFLEKRRIQASIEMTRKYHLTWLHFDGLWQVHGTLHQLANRHVLSVLDVAREHTGLQPLKAPGVFHSDNRVGSGNHALECEASI